MSAAVLMNSVNKVKPALTLLCSRRYVSPAENIIVTDLLQPELQEGSSLNIYRSQTLLYNTLKDLDRKKKNRFLLKEKWLVEKFLQKPKKEALSQKEEKDFHEGVCLLLHTCKQSKDPKVYHAIYSMLNKHGMVLSDIQVGLVLECMLNCGWQQLAEANFRRMTERGYNFRTGALHSFIRSAVRMRDLDFAADMMRELARIMPQEISVIIDKRFPMAEIMDGCVGRGEEGVRLAEKVLDWYQLFWTTINKEVADNVVEWLNR